MKLKKISISIFIAVFANLFIFCTKKIDKASLPPEETKNLEPDNKKEEPKNNSVENKNDNSSEAPKTNLTLQKNEKSEAQNQKTTDINNTTGDNNIVPIIPAIFKAENQSALSFLTNGRITNIYYRAGDLVKQGQILASLEDNNALIDVKTAKIDVDLKKLALEQQQKTVERLEKQFSSGIINTATLEKEKNTLKTKDLEYQSAKASLEGKEYILKSAKIASPFEGIITKVEKSVGDYVTSGTAIFQITEAKNYKIYAQIPVTYFSKFKTGMKFKFQEPISKASGEAEIKRVVSVIDSSSKTFDVYAEILSVSEKLIPGVYLEIKLNP
ncbi:efflux RND transporter periplasmic adaptor subunit [Pigmentibacter sp. JX0631]|uniref:efflux RND transporter periplasmic adaptor subunit n=1 Tax=Pigmentibacter sp. JX0631 TaxID=2976982 RepID=UPI0024692D2B|nr:efflux RND transporter periplasmic adaptor subunit [Pigmentibacter sp. JX0631]WGL58498.1 efflux RND transporter periplasmic adaptor subunit [Pigmentibacter sp. JX0631]